MSVFKPWQRWLAVVVVLALAAVCWQARDLIVPESSESLLRKARSAADRGDWTAAIAAARTAAERSVDASEAWWLIGQWSARLRDYQQAVDAWERVPETSARAAEARLRAAETCLHQLHHLSRAERLYRESQALSPDNPEAVDGLAQTLAISGQWRELSGCLVRLIQLDAYSNFHLDLLARGREINIDPQLLPAVERASADDLAARCARARLAFQTGDDSQARGELESILQSDSDYIPARQLLGQVLRRLDADDDLQTWLRTAPAAMRDEPDYWRTALSAVERRHDPEGAMRCAWELLSRDPTDVAACLVLGRGLRQSGAPELAATLLERAEQLERYATVVSRARQPKDWEAIRQAVELADDLGLSWEAFGWCQVAARLNPDLDWPRRNLNRLKSRVQQLDLVRTDPAHNPAALIDPQQFALPRFDRVVTPHLKQTTGESHSSLAFRNDASRTGLNFEYHNGGDCLRTGLQRMYEFTGGGGGVLDFDGDGFPDLFFPEGGEFGERGQPMSHIDQLWQNRNCESWRNVTAAAGITDDGYGQGVCAGDLDNDGFPDLLVLNIGANVLWHNNGDGTFERSRQFMAFTGNEWSLSAAIADLNGDSYPDIYIANYLTGDDVFSRVCPDSRGQLRLTCQPLVFPAAPDQLLLSDGQGGYQDVSHACGIDKPEGRGMGLLVGRLTSSDTMDVYVANDASANFLFVRDNSSSASLRFSEEAFLRGTAVDAFGKAQASMGIAAGDADGDGRLDLFITNFEGETDSLYLQQSDGQFADRSLDFGVAAPTRSMLGFGTQFLDADLDGYPELIVANGHVNDRRDTGSKYQMRPQLFRNLAGRGFREVSSEEAGPYFQNEYLGRGMAVLDWNRDGRPDVAVSHLDHPVALLANESARRGRWLQVHCVGTTSARDAIGTVVSLHSGDRRIARQLTAGDGYESSNQRTVSFGLGSLATQTVSLEVQWPDGNIAQFTDVPVDCEVVIIEGRSGVRPLSCTSSELP